MSSGNLLRKVALRLIDLLEEHEVPYALMGGIAVPVWGIPRATYDLDVFLVATPYQRAAFARRCRVRIEDRNAWVLSAADLILHKLAAARPKDIADIQNILAVQGIPDEPYLRAWAKRLDAEELLLRAIEEADLPESEG